MKLRSLVAAWPVFLVACGDFRMDGGELTARSAAAPMSPDCASCHAYPLVDTNHTYHLLYTTERKEGNGPLTCMDCHSTAIAKEPFTFRDTFFIDSIGNEWSTFDFPIDPRKPGKADTIRTFTLVRVDSVQQERPIPAPKRPGSIPAFQEYITSIAHMNGKVDVVFHPRNVDTVRFKGVPAEFNPRQETCSAISCHPGSGPGTTPYWRFAAPLKGLRELVGKPGDVP